jgi:glycine cleavage system T protein (aminomethyltransferase)
MCGVADGRMRPSDEEPHAAPHGTAHARSRTAMDNLRAVRRTCLYERHAAAAAKLMEFAGWEMPVQYPTGVKAEHLAVRERCGIFDVSHMGQIEASGPQALDLMQRLLSNDVSKLGVTLDGGGAQYGLLCREDGGVLDDVIVYRLAAERYLTVTNAINHERDLEWLEQHAEGFDAQVADRADDYAMLAVQGPLARELVQAISDAPLPGRMTAAVRRLSGVQTLVCGTGYTGEDGVELLLAPEQAPALWDELVRRGAQPAGLAARDTLRMEACMCLYGNELSLERNPIEAGLGWCCAEDTGFIGADAVRAARASGPPRRLVAFTVEEGAIARAGNAIVEGGVVTSGTHSPSLDVGIGMGYVPSEQAALGTQLHADVRGKIRTLQVARKPLYRKA